MQETNTKGPIGPDGKRYPAYTHWRVDWNYTYQFVPGTCKLVKLTATVSGTITLPRWVDSRDASNSLVQSWDAMVAALRVHENGHYAHGIAAAQEIEALQNTVGSAADCPSLEKEINAQSQAIVDKYSALDVKYDEDTKHGQTQGAVLNYSN